MEGRRGLHNLINLQQKSTRLRWMINIPIGCMGGNKIIRLRLQFHPWRLMAYKLLELDLSSIQVDARPGLLFLNRGNHNIVYANCKGRFGVFDKRTGTEKQYYVGASNMYGHNPKNLKYRFQRVAPIHVSPHNPDVVYHCSQFVHKTTDDGVSWETISPDLTAFEEDKQVISGSPITRDITGEEFYSTIYSIRESPVQEGVIWVGANDGPIHVTTNGGDSWQDVTPKGLLPGGRVDAVEPSPHNASKSYASILRYQMGDWRPYIYRTSDYGKNWTLLTDGENGIPADYPVRVMREDPEVEGLLFAGTEYGLFVSMDDGKKWHAFQQNLPVTPITDLKIVRGDVVMSTMGRGFWILDNIFNTQTDGGFYWGIICSPLSALKIHTGTSIHQVHEIVERPVIPDLPSS